MENTEQKVLQWHPAFYASIQIEFEEEADKLIFENEHNLSSKPLQVDVLIIKKQVGDINVNIKMYKSSKIKMYNTSNYLL